MGEENFFHTLLFWVKKKFINRVKFFFSTKRMEALLDSLRCPITKEIMNDPRILSDDGFSYENTAITEWIETKGTCPSTGEPLKEDSRLVENHRLKRIIDLVAPMEV